MNIEHISVSRKKCYETCPYQYKLKYHLKTPSPVPEPVYFAYGKLVHKIAEVYVERKGETSVGEIAQQVLRGKIEIDDGVTIREVPSDYKNKFQKHLRAIQKATSKMGFDGEVEWPFKYDLDSPHGRNVVGFIDRLIIRGNKAYILDYKTSKKSKWRVNKNTVKQDPQLRTYCRMVQKHYGFAPENIKAALLYLEGEELVAASYTEASLALMEQELLDTYKSIQESDPDKVWGRVGGHCKLCDYSSLCPFYKSTPSQKPDVVWDGDMSHLPSSW